jgi:hypothetical protein
MITLQPSDCEAYVYSVMPFHIIAKQAGDLFDSVASIFNIANILQLILLKIIKL